MTFRIINRPMRRQYPFHLIEPKWQRFWDAQATFRAWNPGESDPAGPSLRQAARPAGAVPPDNFRPSSTFLDMFPYPSGAGLHVGHPEGYTATDILARYRRARGFNVLHPMGWDAFGLPAEQYAIRTGQHPRKTTEANIAVFKRQIKSLGFSYDWSREIDTTDPGYFKWTQWIFLQLYNSWFNPATNKAEPIDTCPICPAPSPKPPPSSRQQRLAYVTEAPVWWCEELGTVLANEEVVDGKSEVGGFPSSRKPMRQWMLRITAYAERLLAGLDTSTGAIPSRKCSATGSAAAKARKSLFALGLTARGQDSRLHHPPRHLVRRDLHGAVARAQACRSRSPPRTQKAAVTAYQAEVASKSDLERTETAREKTGVFTGAYAINPVNNEKIPIWIADYVLATYGTGAIMAVPGPRRARSGIRPKIRSARFASSCKRRRDKTPSASSATASASIPVSSTACPPRRRSTKSPPGWRKKSSGRKTINYKLRDWLFSRQRYWGEPFPIVWKTDDHEALPESALPLLPPDLTDFKPTATGEPPAGARHGMGPSARRRHPRNQHHAAMGRQLLVLPALHRPAQRHRLLRQEAERYWMGESEDGRQSCRRSTGGVDLYVGGIEHAVLHLLYARFWHKVLFDLGHVCTAEAVFQAGQPGPDPGRRRPENVQVPRQRRQSRRYPARIRRGRLPPLRNVHGAAGNGQTVEHARASKASIVSWAASGACSWTKKAKPNSSKTKPRNPAQSGRAGSNPTQRRRPGCAPHALPSSKPFTPASRKSPKTWTISLQHRHFRPDDFCQRRHHLGNQASIRPARLPDLVATLRPAPGRGIKFQTASAPAETLAYEPWPKFDPALLVEDTMEIPVQINGKLRDKIVSLSRSHPGRNRSRRPGQRQNQITSSKANPSRKSSSSQKDWSIL